MTLGDALGLSDAFERHLARAMQLCLLGLAVYGTVTVQLGLAVNGGLALAVTLLPAVLRREYDYRMDAGLVLWITLAVVLHVAGSVALYRQFAWYDEIAHWVSATVVAGIGYAALRAFERHSAAVDVPAEFRAVFVVVFVLAFGVAWEVLEFAAAELSRAVGVRSMLVVYGIDDIVTDMIANAVGAVAVAAWGTNYADGAVAFLSRRLGSKGR